MAISRPTLTLSADQSEVKAGGTILLTAVLAHSGSEAAEYSLSIRGVDASWVTFYPETLNVPAGGQATATVLVAPPVNAAASDLALTVRALGSGPNAEAEATFSVRLISTTGGPTGKVRKKQRLTWPRLLLLGAGVVVIAGAVGIFLFLHRHGSPPPAPTADCTTQPTQVVDLYSDDTTTAIRISDPTLTDVRILRTEPSDTLSPLFSSLLSLSPDGTHLAYVTAGNEALDDAHLWSISVANPAQRQELATIPHGLWQVRPAWSQDNTQVAFLRLNDQQAAASQTQLELWVATVGGQPRKVAAPTELRPDGFYGNGSQSLCWAQDNQSVIFPSVAGNTPADAQGSRAAGATQPAGGAIDAGVPHQVAVNVQTGTSQDLAFPLTATDAAPSAAAAPAAGANCGLPVFSQNDPAWRNIIMQSSGDTIGKFGCAVTATAMLLNYYGSAVTPAQLNTCLGDKADLIDWASVVPCANGAVSASNAFDFAWPSLDQVLASGNPAIVGMVRGQTGLHFVVVVAGGGGDATSYSVIDPWDGTTTKTLQTFLDAGYNLRWIRTYAGTDKACPRLVAPQTPAADATGLAPVPDGPLLAPAQLLPLFTKVADKTGVPRELLLALARTESGFTPRAMGPLIDRFNGTEDAHALGMMQFLPSTYRTFSQQVDAARAANASSAGTYHVLSLDAQATGVAPLGDAGIWDPEASIWAAAFFLQQHNVATDQRGALFAYNNSDTYVDTVLKAAQQFKANTVPDTNLYDPNGTSKPGTLAAPNPVNPPPLSAAAAAAAVPPGAKPANGAAAQGGGGKSGSASSSGGASGAAGNSDSGAAGNAASGSGSGGGQVPIRWSVLEGSISRAPVVLNFNSTDDIGQIDKLTLLTLTVPGSTASPVNESTPSRPFTPGMVITDDGVYQAVITTHAGGQTRTSRRKFTIDRTAPTLDISVVSAGSASTDTTGTGATQSVATPTAQHAVATGAIRLKISYADTLSGVTSVEYRIDNGDWQLYFNAVAFKGDAVIDIPGDHTIAVRATDVAGNISSERTLDFTVTPDANTPVAAGPPSLRPVSSTVASSVTSVVAVTTQPTATTVAPTTVATPAVASPAVAGPSTTTTGSAAAQVATQPPVTPTTLPITVIPTVASTRSTNGIAAASSQQTATVAVTPTVIETPTSTATAVVTPTVTATAVTSTPSVAPTTLAAVSATPSTTVTTTATVTVTAAPTSPVQITAPSCANAAVKSIASCTAATITNVGTTDLHINNINTTGEFLLGDTGATCTTVLAANASCDIPIIFVPTSVGKQTGTLTITDSAPDSPHTVALSGLGVGAAEVSFAPPLFTCPDTLLGRSAPCSITLTNIGSANMTIADGLVVTGDFEPDPQNTNCVATLAVSAHCTIGVIFTPSVHGIRTGLLTINDTAPGSPQYIPLVGKGLSPGVEVSAGLLITPSSISCNNVIVGHSDPCLTTTPPVPNQPPPPALPLTLTNTGDGELDVSSILPHDDFLKLTIPNNCRVVQPQQSCTIPLDFAPIERGAHVSALTFNDNAPGSPQSVQVVGQGIAPVVSLSTQSLVCPDTIVGQSNGCLVPGNSDNPPAPLLLTNVGDSPLNISSIIPNDPFLTTTVTPTQVGTCPLGQPPTAACQLPIPIQFAPTERGTHISGFTITDDAQGSPHSVQVTVKGLAPVVTLSAASLSCPPTIVGQSNACLVPPPTEGVPAPLALTNTGDAPLNVSSIVPNDPFIHVTVDPSCAVIAPSAICTLPISFVPTERGKHVSGLTITDNAPGSPHSVQISVQGLAPVVTLNATSLACADSNSGTTGVIVGQSSPCWAALATETPLKLTNAGDAPLNIASIVVGDDFKMAPGQCPATLPAPSGPTDTANTCTLNVTFAPTIRGNHTSSVTIADNAPGSPHTVQLAAKGLAPVFSLSTQALTCPDTAVGLTTSSCTPPTVTVTNTGDASLRIDSIVPASDFTVSVGPSSTNCGPTLAPNGTCILQITFAPTVSGVHQGNLVFADNAPGSPHTVQMTAKGLAPVVSLNVTSITCPLTIVGQSSDCTVAGDPPLPLVLTNTGDAPLHISGIVPNDPFLTVDVTQADVPPCTAGSVPAVCQLQIPIHFTPTERGIHTSGLTITDNALGSPHAVPITAQGLAPVFSLDATTVNCPDTAVGSTNTCTPATLTLTNTGDAPLNVSSIVPSKDFTVGAAATGTQCGASLAGGAACTFQITFSPTTRGIHEGNVTITDNAPGSPHSLQVLAKGLAPIVTLSASSLTCPPTIVGTSGTCGFGSPLGPLTLTNTGDAPLNVSSIVPNDPFIHVTVDPSCAVIAPNAVCTLPVSFVPTERGSHVSGLTITDNAIASPHTVQIPVQGLAPVFSLNTQAVTCPPTIVGASTAACTPALTFTNSGDAPLNVLSIVPSSDFTIAVSGTGCGSVIAAGVTCNIAVTFAPTVSGVHQGSLVFADNAPGSPQSLQMTATGLAPAVTLSASSLTCPDTVVGAAPSTCGAGTPGNLLPLTLTNSGTSPLNIASIVVSDDFKIVSGQCPATLPATSGSNSCTLNVTFAPTTRGDHTSNLVIADDAPGSPHTVQLAAKGLAPVFSLSATALTCPDTAVGLTTNACTPSMLTLTNTGDANLTISSIVPSSDFTVGAAPTGTRCGATLAGGATCTLQITFAPTVAGTHQGSLVFSDNAPGSPHSVQMTAKGLAPVIALNATALTCPDTIVGAAPATCTPQPLTLTNTGDAPLTISSIAQGNGFSVAPTGAGCGATIAPNGGVCSLQVSFVPTARGTYTDSLTITDNALGSPHTVQLTGKALAPVVSLSATALTCADTNAGTPGVVVGTTSACGSPSTPTVTPLTLTNNGDAPLNIASIVAGDDFKVDPAQCPATLPATSGSNTCTLHVSFAPTTGGSHSSNLAIADNAPGSPHTVQLSAMGLAAVATLSTQSVACGGSPVGTPVTCPVFTLSNSGTSPLTITNIVLNGDFTAAVAPSCGTTLQPGVTCQVTVTFGPTAAGSRVGSVAITDNAPGSPQTVALSGTGQAPVVSLSASAVTCSDTAVGATSTCGTTPITLTNTGDTALAISSIVTSSDFKVDPTSCPATLPATSGSNSCTLQVSFVPTTAGSLAGNLTIIDNAAGSPHAVQLTGTGLAPVVSSLPQSIACGGTLVGTSIACTPFTIVNSGTAALTISSIALDGNFNATTTNCGAVIQPGQSPLCQVTVTFGPTAAGNRVGSLTITDNAAGSPQTIPLTGTGQAPILSLSASTVTCPDTAVGGTGTCGTPSLTLTNTGDAPLTITSIVATDDFKVTAPVGGCGTTLPATTNNSCTLQVTFTPTSAGNHTGNVTITDNAAGSPHTVQFTGNATAPVVSFSVPSVACPDTEVGKTNTCATIIEMTNSGNAPLTWTSIGANSPFGVANTTCVTATGLSAGANCQITVNFTPTATGTTSGFLTITDNATGSPHTVPLSGNGVVLPAATVTSSGACPDTTVGSTAACATRITIANGAAASGNLVMSQIAITSEFGIDGANSNCGTTVTPGNNCVLAITFTPLLDGQRSGTVTITDNAASSPQSITLSGKGLGTPQVTLSPTSVACPDTAVGTTAPCPTHVTLSNPGSAQLTLTQIAVTGEFGADAGNTTCGATVAPGTTCVLAVNFTPTASGARPAGALQITDNATGSPQSVTLTGNGTQPGLTIGPPTTITCADTIVNTTTTCSLGITNPGNASLTLNLSVTPGSDYALHTGGTNACGTSLSSTSGSNTCTLFVDFKPTATGTRTGTLNLGDNAPGGPHTVPLTGNGTQPAVTLSTTSITCADTATNTTGNCGQVTVQNSGTAILTFVSAPATAAPFGVDSARTTCASTLAVGANCTIAINFTPTATGSRTGTLSITDNASPSTQSVNLSGNGVATTPALSVPSGITSCPSTAVNSTGTCTVVTLSNASATTAIALTLPFTAAGDFSVASTTCGASLAASGSCTLTMNFTPTAQGTRNGTATITYTPAGGSQQTAIIAYKGTGT